LISLIIITLLVHLVVKEYQKERLRSQLLYQQTLSDKQALEKAFAEIKVLKGILPICSFCKKIRDDNNQWHTMEHYIAHHSQAEFSHGVCADCGKKHYPDHFEGTEEFH
jgi:ABC-type nickel/cobalt efflux system permease component RcnA